MAVAGGEVIEKLDDMIVRQAEATGAQVAAAKAAIGKVIFGQETVVEQALMTVLSGGHALLVGLPGLAKTKLVETMGIVLGLDARRIQFTPDLMPSDIVGSEVLEEGAGGKRSFRFIPGPIFCQLLMADEINRASPRTQSALLQAMQELHVTDAGNAARRAASLPRARDAEPDRAGRHLSAAGSAARPLPDADRRAVSRPRQRAKDRVRHHRRRREQAEADHDRRRASRRAAPGAPAAGRRIGRRGDPQARALGAPRPESGELGKLISWGPSPRASQALMLVARARALIDGRLSPSIDDVMDMAEPILKHRMALTFAARADGETVEGVIGKLKARIG